MVLARQSSYDKKTLARQVIPLVVGYRTAISSRPGFSAGSLNLIWSQEGNFAFILVMYLVA